MNKISSKSQPHSICLPKNITTLNNVFAQRSKQKEYFNLGIHFVLDLTSTLVCFQE